MSISDTSICNMALGRIGANRINDLSDTSEDSAPAIHCRLHYEQTRDAQLRSGIWKFAITRATLSVNTVAPDFGFDNAYDLPADFLRMINVFEDNNNGEDVTRYTYRIEGDQILSDEDDMEIRYVKRVTDPTAFDPLFVEVLVLQLALKLVMPLSQDKALRREIYDELWGRNGLMARARAVNKQETDSIGRGHKERWIDGFVTGAGNPMKSYS